MTETAWFIFGFIVGFGAAVVVFNLFDGLLDALRALVRRK